MKRILKYFLIILICMDCPTNLFSQNAEKENIAVLPFSGWHGADAEIYQNSITDQISTLIIQSQRFNVIDRANLNKILKEHGLQMSGIIDQQSAVEFGKLSGVHKFIIGSFIQNSTDFHKEKYMVYDKEKDKEIKVSDTFFSAEINVAIKLLDVQSGKYIEAAEANGYGRGTNRKSAYAKAILSAAKHTVDAFFEYFAIQTFIESVDKSNVIIEGGKLSGIKRLMNFEILDISKEDMLNGKEITSATKRIGLVKIVSAEKNSAVGRLIGEHGIISAGNLLREVKEDLVLEASIIKKDGGDVIVNIGNRVGVKKGTTFNVIEKSKEYIDPVTGESFGREETIKGIIYVSKVGPRISRAKIIKGRFNIKEGMSLKETKGWKPTTMYNLAFSVGKANAKANTSPWKGEIGNRYVVNRIDSVDYSGYENLTRNEMIKFQIGTWDVVNSFSLIWGFAAYNVHDDLSIFLIDLSYYKHFWIIPEYFYIYPGAGLGLGIASQQPKAGLVDFLSNDNDEKVSSMELEISLSIGARLALGKFNIFGEISYTGLKFDKWEYEVEYKDKKGDKKTKDITIPDYLLPYPDVSLSGPSIRIGVAWLN